MTPPDDPPIEVERAQHRYRGNTIPWYVHVMWVAFWTFAVLYLLTYLVPALRRELLTPP